MSIRAQSADGQIHEFPDGTSNAVVDRVMKQYATQSRPSTGFDVANGFVQGARDAVGGMLRSVTPRPIAALADAATGAARANPAANALMTPYDPETEAGKVARTAGQMAPNALAPGSAIGRAANVIVPTITTELAGRAAQALGANDTGVAVARFAGGLGGGVAANVRAPAPAAPRAQPRPRAPSLDELRTAKDGAYRSVDAAGVTYKPEAVSGLTASIRAKVDDAMIDPDLHPKATAIMRRIDALKDSAEPLTLPKLDQIRRLVNENVLASPAKDERRIGYVIKDMIDDFVATTDEASVSAGSNPAEAAATIRQARELNTRVSKIEALEAAKARARNATSPSGSGGNIDNNTRREVGKVTDRGRNWTPTERQALQKVRDGSRGQNALRTFGKTAPTGNGLMQVMHLGAAAKSGGLSVPVSVAAVVAKHIADGMTKAKVDRVIDLIARGGNPDALAAQDQKVGLLMDDLKAALSSPTVQAITAESSDPRWLRSRPAQSTRR